MTRCELTNSGRLAADELVSPIRNDSVLVDPHGAAAGLPFRPVGRGAYRFVYEYDPNHADHPFGGADCVLKAAQRPHREANRREAAVWTMGPTELQPLLVPVTDWASDGAWIVQPKADTDIGFGAVDDFRDRRQRLTDIRLTDVTRDNLGLYDGEYRLLDYGEEAWAPGEGYLFDSPPMTLP